MVLVSLTYRLPPKQPSIVLTLSECKLIFSAVVESVLRGGRQKEKGTEVMRRAWLGLGVLEKCLDFVKRKHL